MLIAIWTASVAGIVEFDDAIAWRFHITQDWGFGEMFTYGKWLALVVLCLLSWREGRSALFLGFAFCFLVMLVDDAMQVHERMGWVLEDWLELVPAVGLRAKDFGELLTWAGLGAVVAAVLALGFAKAPARDRRAGLLFLAVVGALVICGAVFDMAGMAFDRALPPFGGKDLLLWAIALAEDGGEMVVASIGVGIAAALRVGDREGSHARRRPWVRKPSH